MSPEKVDPTIIPDALALSARLGGLGHRLCYVLAQLCPGLRVKLEYAPTASHAFIPLDQTPSDCLTEVTR